MLHELWSSVWCSTIQFRHLLIIFNQIIFGKIGCSACLRLMKVDPAVHADTDTTSGCWAEEWLLSEKQMLYNWEHIYNTCRIKQVSPFNLSQTLSLKNVLCRILGFRMKERDEKYIMVQKFFLSLYTSQPLLVTVNKQKRKFLAVLVHVPHSSSHCWPF
jgi:hypothetical protein